MRIVRRIGVRTGDQIPVVSCVDSTVQIKWQVTVVSKDETMPVPSRWNGRIVPSASIVHNGQSGPTDPTDQRDRTGPDTTSRLRKNDAGRFL